MTKYSLRNQTRDVESLAGDLQNSPYRMRDIQSARYNVDNCSCPSCPCCDSGLPKAIKVAGAGVLAASTPILVAAVAAKVASRK